MCLVPERPADDRGVHGAQRGPTPGGGPHPAGAAEQGAEAEARGDGGDCQEQVQGRHRGSGGQDLAGGGAAGRGVKVSEAGQTLAPWLVDDDDEGVDEDAPKPLNSS